MSRRAGHGGAPPPRGRHSNDGPLGGCGSQQSHVTPLQSLEPARCSDPCILLSGLPPRDRPGNLSPGAHAAHQRAGRIRIKTQAPTAARAIVYKDRQGSGLPLSQGVCVCVRVRACVTTPDLKARTLPYLPVFPQYLEQCLYIMNAQRMLHKCMTLFGFPFPSKGLIQF